MDRYKLVVFIADKLHQFVKIMTTLEWILIGVIAVLLAILIPIFVYIHKFGKTLKKVQF